MKIKNLLNKLIVCTVVSTLFLSANELLAQDHRITSVDMEMYDGSSLEFTPYVRYQFSYGENGNSDKFTLNDLNSVNLIEFDTAVGYMWDTDALEEAARLVNLYNADGTINTQKTDEWNGFEWNTIAKTSYVYDSEGNLTSSTMEEWDMGANAWVNDYRNVYTYDSNLNISDTYQQYTGTQWENMTREIYGYDSEGNKISVIKQYWQSNTWVNAEKEIYSYTGNNKTSIEYSDWNTSSELWYTLNRTDFEYDSDGWLTSETYKFLNVVSVWENVSRTLYTHDSGASFYSTQVEQSYDDIDSEWENDIKLSYAFTSFNEVESIMVYEWDGALWMPFQRVLIEYETYSATGINNHDYNELKTSVYPVPATDNVTVQFENPGNSPVHLSVFDALGRQISSKQFENLSPGNVKVSWNAAEHNAESGVYFYQLRAGNSVSGGKIIVQ